MALLACSGVIPPPTDYNTFVNLDNNFTIPYPKEFSLEPGNSVGPGDPATLGNATTFAYTIPPDPTCKSPINGAPNDFIHPLSVNILKTDYLGATPDQLKNFIVSDSL